MSVWDLPHAALGRGEGERGEKREGGGDEVTGRVGTPHRVSEDAGDVARSLPAPPRASMRRARVSTSMNKSPLGHTLLLPAIEIGAAGSGPLAEVTNTSPMGSNKDVEVRLEKLVLNETTTQTRTASLRSPSRRLGPRRRMSPATSSPTAKGGAYRVVPLA